MNLFFDSSALVKRYVNLNREQLAAGLPTITLVAADDELLAAAHAEGLLVENPQHHP